jgi:hypothetical protein
MPTFYRWHPVLFVGVRKVVSMKLMLIGSAILAALVGGYFVFADSEPKKRPSRSAQPASEFAPVVPPLSPATPSGRADLGVAAKAPSASSAGPVPSAPVDTSTSLDEERRAYADAAFDRDAWDRDWSRTTERDLTNLFDGVAVEGVAVESLECRGTLCRVHLSPALTAPVGDFVRGFMYSRRWPGGFLVVPGETDKEGKRSFTMYLAREGTLVPQGPSEETGEIRG